MTIIEAGAWALSEYDTSEMREALEKAFVRDRMESITLRNSRSESKFLAASAAWGVEAGLLIAEDKLSLDEQDAGDVVLRLTTEGRTEFGLAAGEAL